ncbi:MAG: site-2 protease family protein [Pirellulaceae bacterium]
MRQYTSWSVMFFRWRGLQVRVHLFFLLFAAFTLFLASQRPVAGDSLLAIGFLTILLVSVLLHELGHYVTAVRFGGDGRLLVLWPLGGLCPLQPPLDPHRELWMHIAGPLVNLSMCLISGIYVAAFTGSEWMGLMHPLAPANLLGATSIGWVLQTAKLVFWVNWVLVLVNLLPAVPFDGGRALRSALVASRAEMTPRRAAAVVALIAKLTSLGLLIAAALWWNDSSPRLVPIWFPLTLLALFLYFSARQEEDRAEEAESDDDMFGYDFSQGYTSLERSEPSGTESIGPFRRWMEERRLAREQRQKQIEADEERRVDEILSRLHERGIDSLSAEDRSLLKRVSQRLRQRQASGEDE